MPSTVQRFRIETGASVLDEKFHLLDELKIDSTTHRSRTVRNYKSGRNGPFIDWYESGQKRGEEN